MTVSGSHISRLFFQNGTVPMYFNYSKDDDPASIISNLQYEVWYKDIPYSWFEFNSNINLKREFSLGFNSAEKFENILLNDGEGLTSVLKQNCGVITLQSICFQAEVKALIDLSLAQIYQNLNKLIQSMNIIHTLCHMLVVKQQRVKKLQ